MIFNILLFKVIITMLRVIKGKKNKENSTPFVDGPKNDDAKVRTTD